MPKKLPEITIVRAYDVGDEDVGYRILVDRLWPRGLSKETLQLDEWLKDLALSAELRRWFNHRPERWNEFRQRYALELKAQPDEVDRLLKLAARYRIALLFGARDVEHNNAVALKEFLQSLHAKIRRPSATSEGKQ